jgi:hypothetical protein
MTSTTANFGCIEGSGNSTTQDRQMEGFTQIKLNGDYTVTLTQSNTMVVGVTADDNLQQYVSTTVSNGMLTISTTANICGSANISITIGIGTLTSLVAGGKDGISSEGTITTDSLSFTYSGAETVNLDLSVTTLNTSVTGKATTHEISVSGSSTLNALDLQVSTFVTHTSGSGKYYVSVSETLTANTTGASVIEYQGNPTVTNNNKGSSKITQIN